MKYFDKGYLPLLTGGASTKYYSDYTYMLMLYNITFYLAAGGNTGSGLATGPFYFDLHIRGATSGSSIAACISLKPLLKEN